MRVEPRGRESTGDGHAIREPCYSITLRVIQSAITTNAKVQDVHGFESFVRRVHPPILIYNFPRAAGRHVLQDTVRPVVLASIAREAVAIRYFRVVAGRRLVF